MEIEEDRRKEMEWAEKEREKEASRAALDDDSIFSLEKAHKHGARFTATVPKTLSSPSLQAPSLAEDRIPQAEIRMTRSVPLGPLLVRRDSEIIDEESLDGLGDSTDDYILPTTTTPNNNNTNIKTKDRDRYNIYSIITPEEAAELEQLRKSASPIHISEDLSSSSPEDSPRLLGEESGASPINAGPLELEDESSTFSSSSISTASEFEESSSDRELRRPRRQRSKGHIKRKSKDKQKGEEKEISKQKKKTSSLSGHHHHKKHHHHHHKKSGEKEESKKVKPKTPREKKKEAEDDDKEERETIKSPRKNSSKDDDGEGDEGGKQKSLKPLQPWGSSKLGSKLERRTSLRLRMADVQALKNNGVISSPRNTPVFGSLDHRTLPTSSVAPSPIVAQLKEQELEVLGVQKASPVRTHNLSAPTFTGSSVPPKKATSTLLPVARKTTSLKSFIFGRGSKPKATKSDQQANTTDGSVRKNTC